MQNKKISQSVILACSHISKKFNTIEVLKNITFTIVSGERIGLVGSNGSGKSTLLKIVAGLLENDDGVISHSKKLKIEYLPQTHFGNENLSGGEMAKKILAPIMASEADLFLLDEPTNNLDIEGLETVENFIKKSDKAFLIVSHDRMFLDRIVSKIIEIDSVVKSLFIYGGNYSDYIKEREARIERQWKDFTDKTEQIDKMSSSVNQRLSWMKEIENKRKDNKNLPIHEKEKPQAALLRDKEAKAGKRAKALKDRLAMYEENTEEVVRPPHLLPLKIVFDNERGSTKVFTLKDVQKKIGKRDIGPLNLNILYGDRVHISGKNGVGKTTLLKMLIGEISADSGAIEKGENLKIGYISQEKWSYKSRKTVIEEFIDTTKVEETDARKILNRFRITAEDVGKDVSLVSPGEYSRLIIAEMVALKPNCIILDEPSNHLDLEVLEELENGLKEYKGTLVVVSHDRYFLDKLKLNTVFDLDLNSRIIG
ncbi:MAG: ABC-F family ATP-binding cassette domain-containing protein [bacterium]